MSGLYLARGGHVGRAARHGDPSLLEQGGVDVDALDEGGGAPDALAAGAADHQRDLGAVLEVRHLGPDVIVAQVPAVVAPHGEHIVVALGEGCLLEGIEHLADLRQRCFSA